MRATRWLFIALILAACGGAPVAASPTPQAAMDGFKAAGLPVGTPRPVTRDEMGLAPYMHQDGMLAEVTGGTCTAARPCRLRVLAFKDEADLKRVEGFYVEAGRQSAAFGSHVHRRGLLLMQVSSDLDPPTADRFKAALDGLK